MQLVSHDLCANFVMMEGWKKGLLERAATKSADIEDVAGFSHLLIHQTFSWAVLCINLPHVPHILKLLFHSLAYFNFVLTLP